MGKPDTKPGAVCADALSCPYFSDRCRALSNPRHPAIAECERRKLMAATMRQQWPRLFASYTVH